MRTKAFFLASLVAFVVAFVAGCRESHEPDRAAPSSARAQQGLTIAAGGTGAPQAFATLPVIAQTFLVPASPTTYLDHLDVVLDAQGGSYKLEAYAWDDGLGTVSGAALATTTQNGGNGAATYSLAVGAPVTAGAKIALVVTCAACGAGYVDGADGDPYAAGGSFVPDDGMTVTGHWTANGAVDLRASAVFLAVTTTALAADSPRTYGQSVGLTATVTNGSGGTVSFTDDKGAALPTVALAAGVASTSTTALAAGTHTLTASYGGSADARPSSDTATVVIDQAATTTSTVTATQNPATIGAQVTFSTTVSPQYAGKPTGTVTFFADGQSIGTGAVDASGKATLAYTGLGLGSHAITAVYGGDGNFATSTTGAPLTELVEQDGVTVVLGSSGTPSTYGNPVTYNATVTAGSAASGALTGSITFVDGATTLGTVAVDAAGKASIVSTAPASGTHTIQASYGGDPNHKDASATFTQRVDPATTTVTVAPIAAKVYGEAIAFTATVGKPGGATATPTGTITFKVGASTVGAVAVDGAAQGSFAPVTGSIGAGSYTVTAVYDPGTDPNYAGSSGTTPLVVNAAASATALTSSMRPAPIGGSVTLTATVTAVPPSSGTPAGTVQFLDDGTVLGSAAVNASGVAAVSTSFAAAGTHPLTAVFSSSTGNFGGSTGTLSQRVTQLDSTINLASSSSPSTFGDSVVFTATVASTGSGTPSGNVVLKDESTGAQLATITLVNGAGSFATAALAAGAHSLTATYGGDATFSAGGQFTLVQTVRQATTSSSVTTSLTPSVYGQALTFTANVASAAAAARSGSVRFMDGATILQTAAVNGNAATFTTAALAAGTHAITAVYSGDTNFGGSTTSALSQVVQKGATTTTLLSSSNPSLIGTSVIFTATVSANAPSTGVPTGTVSFKDGTATIGSASLDATGNATFATAALAAGDHKLTAVYGGSTNHSGSSSGVLTQRVNTEAATISLAATPTPPPPHGEPITLTATLTGKQATPTGSMLFKEGPATIGAGTLAAGVSSFQTTALAAGKHTIVAAYSGDLIYAVGTGAVSLSVAKQTTTTTVTSSANPAPIGEAVTLTAEIGSGSDGFTGQVEFFDAQTSLGFGALTGARATLVVGNLAAGDHAIGATYGGDANFEGSAATALLVRVGVAADAGTGADGGLSAAASSDDGGGCGCRTVGAPPLGPAGGGGLVGGVAVVLGLLRSRRRRR